MLVDSSVWIEFLRGTPTRSTEFVREHVGIDVATCEPVVMELLAGARPGPQAERLERVLEAQGWCRVDAALDFRGAVDVFHAARAHGHQPRSLQDCLIAAVALRHDVPVVHRDVDFEHISAATGLRVLDLR